MLNVLIGACQPSSLHAVSIRSLRIAAALVVVFFLYIIPNDCYAGVTAGKFTEPLQLDPTALANARAAAEHGDAMAQTVLGLLLFEGYGVPKDREKAVEWFAKAAAQGNDAAQVGLGMAYATGEGVPRNDVLAVEWLRKAAGQKNASALSNLAYMVEAGRGVPKDAKQALGLIHHAADLGDIRSQLLLGYLYRYGLGVQHDDKLALGWYRRAADQGSAAGELEVGYMTATGRGVRSDDVLSAQWYRKAAAQGHRVAQYNLGLRYESGTGVKRDYTAAAQWMRKSAEQGYALAQSKLGSFYREALGVAQDNLLAVEWYRMAALQGDLSAIAMMQSFYTQGIGVLANPETANEWRRKMVEQKMADQKIGKQSLDDKIYYVVNGDQFLLQEEKRKAVMQGAAVFKTEMIAKKSDGNLEVELVLTDDPKKLHKDWESPAENLNLTTTSNIQAGTSIHGFAIFSGCTGDFTAKCTVSVSYQVFFPDGSLHSMSATGFPLNNSEKESGPTLSFAIPIKVETNDPLGIYVVQARVRDLHTDSTLEVRRAFTVSPRKGDPGAGSVLQWNAPLPAGSEVEPVKGVDGQPIR